MSSQQRRASLPSADELFRPTGPRPPRPEPPGDADERPDEGDGSAPRAAPVAPLLTDIAVPRAVPDEPAAPPARLDEDALAELAALAADEDDAMTSARQRAIGTPAPAPEIGSALAWVASCLDAKTVVGVGDVAGLAGLWVLRGMRAGGMLTTINADARDHESARHAFQEAGLANRVRAIQGSAEEVLPRLSDGGYDLVVIGPAVDGPRGLRDHALRLVRPGGVVAVIDVAHDDDASRKRRLIVREFVEDPRCAVTVLPIDAGLAVARFTPGG